MTSGAQTAPFRLAVDIGGTKADVALVSNDGVVRQRARVGVRGNRSLLDDLIATSRELTLNANVLGAGVACAGPVFDGGRRVSPLNIPQWRDVPLRGLLEESLQMPVGVDGDVRALALAEQRFGGAMHRRNFASLVVSTGIGGALVLDGRLVHGRSGNAGHLGHLIAVPEGHECSCGSRGCLEAEVSGWALERDLGGSPHNADADTRRRVGELVGRTVGSTLCVLDIDVCFVSGSVALGFGEGFFQSANRAAADVAKLSYCESVTFVPSALGEDAPLLGAACVGWDS